MAFTDRDPLELIARHQHECWVAWAKSVEMSVDIPDKLRRRWEARFVSFDLLPEHAREAYFRRAEQYVAWVKESLLPE